jgi:hypothetical protein
VHLNEQAATANVPAPAATPHLARSRRGWRRSLLLVVAALSLGACGRPDAIGGGEAGSANTGAAAAEYPSLATVPPRPRLSYGVEQRRAVEDQLVRDRANAARVAAEIDHELGRSPAPPPPVAPAAPASAAASPLPAEAGAAERRPRGPGDDPLVEAYVAEAMARDEDEGELRDFMRRLERPPAPVAEPEKAGVAPPAAPAPRPASLARVLGLEAAAVPPVAAPAAAAPAATPERPRSDALDRFGGHLGGILALDGAAVPAAEAAPAEPGGTGVLASVSFSPGGSGLPAEAEADLGRALAQARRAGTGLRIAAGGGDGALRADRARAVAAVLVRLGAAAGTLELAGGEGGAGEGEVRVSLAGRS